MISFEPLYQIIILSLIVIGIVRFLKWKGIFTEQDQPVFDKLVTELAVPGIIFFFLVTSHVTIPVLIPAGILFIALIITLCIAYAICLLFQFSPKKTGTIVMVSGFGSTATLGSSLLFDMFHYQSGAIDEGLAIGTIGIAFPFFTLGVLIASYFGTKELGKTVNLSQTLWDFLMTPIFISLLLGVAVSFVLQNFAIPGADVFIDIVDHFFNIITLSLSLLIWISIGLMIKPGKKLTIISLLCLVVLLKMILEPAITISLAGFLGFPPITTTLVVLMSAMPSGAVAAVLASRYGCDGSLAGWMVVGTYLVSLVLTPLILIIT
jgi:predicted permease